MIHGNNKQLAGSWVNLPPDGSPQDLGKASSSIFLSRIHIAEVPLPGKGGKGNHKETYRLHLSQQFQTGT